MRLHRVLGLMEIRKQPLHQLARVLDEALVVDLGQDEDAVHLQLHADAAEMFRELAHAPGHVGQLALREHARMHVRPVRALLGHLGRRVQVPDQAGAVGTSALAFQQRVDEACCVAVRTRQRGRFGVDERRLAPVAVLAVEDHLLLPGQRARLFLVWVSQRHGRGSTVLPRASADIRYR